MRRSAFTSTSVHLENEATSSTRSDVAEDGLSLLVPELTQLVLARPRLSSRPKLRRSPSTVARGSHRARGRAHEASLELRPSAMGQRLTRWLRTRRRRMSAPPSQAPRSALDERRRDLGTRAPSQQDRTYERRIRRRRAAG